MTIIGTPITSASTNAYVSLAEADAYFAARLTGSSSWAAASVSDKTDALNEATATIDALPLRGCRYEPEYIYNGAQKDTNADGLTQLFAFPRVIDGTILDWDNYTQLPIVPQAVKDACCLIAKSIIDDDGADDFSEKALQEAGVQSFSRGKLSVTFQPGAGNRYMGLPVRAYNLLRKYIDMGPRVL